VAFLSARPLEITLAAAIALGFGAVAAVITGSWWVLPLAAGINALGTIGAATAVIQIKAARSPRVQPRRSGATARERPSGLRLASQ
jgi:hypothetical protein